MKWTMTPPPFGVWAYSMPEGLFRIEGKTDTGYLMVYKVCEFTRYRLDTGTQFTPHVTGPFIYPLPDPTKGVEP